MAVRCGLFSPWLPADWTLSEKDREGNFPRPRVPENYLISASSLNEVVAGKTILDLVSFT